MAVGRARPALQGEAGAMAEVMSDSRNCELIGPMKDAWFADCDAGKMTGPDPRKVHSEDALVKAWHLSSIPKAKRPFAPTADESEHFLAIALAVSGDVEGLGRLAANLEGGSLDVPDGSGNSPLIWAAEHNQVEVVEYLLTLGEKPTVDLARRGYLGNTALSRACCRGHTDIVRLLLERDPSLAKIPNDKLQYPMHFAAFKQKIGALEVLLEEKYGLDTLVVDRKGRTPLEDTSSEEAKDLIRA
eukprot:CAMPEP_0180621706 /NCGR_PEP_ID=MMETSP1037_2-20121125/35290_1 /TAXON_ID=632150 /ORGANISM="Azadinium spinosum, Strain 3D9" /LENGTH=243 /DNA_ID=CAMNT_0022641897 /DNA_START=8 /DNA_END=737 /DNA_ORIENTATION=-